MAKQIVLVEDEPILCENYASAMRGNGYEVITISSKEKALQQFQHHLPDMAVLDIGLGDDVEAGFDLCRELRAKSSSLPIIFLTARDSDFDTISGLRLGADDYLSKDTSMPHLLARMSALFRRIQAMQNKTDLEDQIHLDELLLDTKRFQVAWRSNEVELSLTEFWMLHCLVKRPGHVKNREQLMQDANIFVDDGTITSHVKRIRKKFRLVDSDFDHIETVYGIGYRWKA